MINYDKLKTISLRERAHKVSIKNFGDPNKALIDSFPDILAGASLKKFVEQIKEARNQKKALIWALGAHVLKCGLTPFFIRLMDQGYVTHIALNGAGIIHDFEIGYIGETSECVEEAIRDGSFGMATETSEILGNAIKPDKGIGSCVAEVIKNTAHRDHSLIYNASIRNIQVSVHPALGTDVLHYHPALDWADFAAAARIDFDKFVEAVGSIGVYVNVGSAVILPEVFLKSLSVLRNLGHEINDFTTATFDMIDHYRPRENVVRRPGGRGCTFIGHHEIMIPLLTYLLGES